MSLRGCFAAFLLLLCAFVTATDYELVVPSGWSGLKNASTISLSDSSGRFKDGDRIVRIRTGVSASGGTSVRLYAGSTVAKATLAEKGTVDGFAGQIVLGKGRGSSVGAFALTTAIQNEPPKPQPKGFVEWIWGMTAGLPWGLILMGLGVIVVTAAIILMKKGGPEHSLGMPFGNKRVIEEGFRDVRSRLEQIIAAQTELVRKPPVLRTFRKDIENFHNRLHKLENSQQAANATLERINSTLGSLENRIATLTEQNGSIVSDQRKTVDALTKFGTEQTTITARFEEKTASLEKEITASLSRLDLVHRALEKAEQERAVLSNKLEIADKNSGDHYASLRKDLEAAAHGLDELSKSVATVAADQAHIRDLPAAVELTGENVQEVLNKHKITVEQLTDLQSEFESLRMLIQGLQIDKPVMEQFATVLSEFEALKMQVRAFSDSVTKKLEALSSQNETVDGHLQTITANVTDVLTRAERFDAHLDEIGSGIQSVSSRTEQFEGHLHQIGSGLENVSTKAEQFEGKLQEIGSGIQNVSSRTEQFEGRIAEFGHGLEAKLETSLQQGLNGVTEVIAEATKSVPATEQQVVEESSAEAQATEESEPVEELEVEEEPEAEIPLVAQEEPELEVSAEGETSPAEKVNEQAAEVEPEPEETPSPEPYFEEAPVVEETAPELELLNNDAAEEEEIEDEFDTSFMEQKDRWLAFGGSTERRWSLELPSSKMSLKTQKAVKPLTPIDTPGIEAPIGGLIYLGNGLAYSHGDCVRNFWPGREDKSVQLESQIPADAWRIMGFGGYLYNVAEHRVEVVHVGTWANHASFEGEYLAQTSTDSHWAGLLSWSGELAVDFRDASGQHVGSPRTLDLSSKEKVQVVSSGKKIYIVAHDGAIHSADLLGTEMLEEGRKGVELISVSVNRGSLLTFEKREAGTFARLWKEGQTPKELELEIENISCPPVLLEDKFYTFDSKTSELVIGSLRGFKNLERKPLDNVLGVRRIVGLRVGKTHLLGIVATDDNNLPVQAMVVDAKGEHTTSLGMVNMPKVDLIVAGTHFVLATSCSYQNTLSVFDPFEAVEDEKAA